jgi:ORF6N domain-containing protein
MATTAVAIEEIASRILLVRGVRVMLDADLATLYGVETRVLVQAVKRNVARFPADFMFQLAAVELAGLRSQSVISNMGRGGRRTAPYAFTEYGALMALALILSSCLLGLRCLRNVALTCQERSNWLVLRL